MGEILERYHPLAKCEECPLQGERTYVPSVGPEEATIAIVGEAPGFNEVKEGIPFTGDAGKLLNMVLRHNGIEREECFVTNTVCCRPPGNENPPEAAIRACSDRLAAEILDHRPARILAVGSFAARAILDTSEGVTNLRVGPPKRSSKYPGVEIIPTFHTAAALYNPGVFPDIVTDVGKLAGIYVPPKWVEPGFTVHTPESGAQLLIQLLSSGQITKIALDLEIGVEKDLEFEHSDRYKILALGLAFTDDWAHVLSEEAMAHPKVQELVGHLIEKKQIICHNGKFDLQGLLRFGDGKLFFDTMLASYAMDERKSGIHGLEYQSIERLGSPTWKHVIARYLGKSKNFASIPREVLYQYNAFDVVNTFRLYQYFDANLPEDLRRLHDHMVEVSNVMQYVERNGVAVDMPYLEVLEEEYQDKLTSLLTDLRNITGDKGFNPNSPLQVKTILKAVFKRGVKDTRKDTIIKLMESAARVHDDRLYAFCRDHLQFKAESKSYGTYVKGTRIRVSGGRVYPTYLLHGTTNGRSSCRNPNLQNVTRGSTLRKLFIPGSDETTLVQADYRQVEFRVICALAREPYLRSIFLDPSRNIHEEVGKAYYGDTFTKADKERYIRAKAVVFGLSYGREAYSLSAEFGISEAEAQGQIEAFFRLIPEVVKWRDGVQRAVLNGEDLISPYGQHRRFHLITAMNRKDILKEALSFLPQNVAAHTTYAAAVEMVKRDPSVRDMLRINVHDSWVLEAHNEDATEVGRFVAEVMEETAKERFTDYVPFPVDVGYGPSWGEITDSPDADLYLPPQEEDEE